ncbi:hypothetical protein CWB98_01035 [Pseudoalteromonas rubra]|uniref:Uncharacterized protein n=2 Tax=Pseudoalteromonas rubra TaxID=43658 RepID=A0A5S3X6A1_9GAMM|nr:hypothetical protein CWB98_01035 [Pseudoalteromonas rubra]
MATEESQFSGLELHVSGNSEGMEYGEFDVSFHNLRGDIVHSELLLCSSTEHNQCLLKSSIQGPWSAVVIESTNGSMSGYGLQTDVTNNTLKMQNKMTSIGLVSSGANDVHGFNADVYSSENREYFTGTASRIIWKNQLDAAISQLRASAINEWNKKAKAKFGDFDWWNKGSHNNRVQCQPHWETVVYGFYYCQADAYVKYVTLQ